MAKWQKGQSGNPKGRKKGVSTHSTDVRKHLQTCSKELVDKVLELALGGDLVALKLCLERICPPLKNHSDVLMPLQQDSDTALADLGASVIKRMAMGEIAITDSERVINTLVKQAELKNMDELAERLERLEKIIQESEADDDNL